MIKRETLNVAAQLMTIDSRRGRSYVKHPVMEALNSNDYEECFSNIWRLLADGTYNPGPTSHCVIPTHNGYVRYTPVLRLRDALVYYSIVVESYDHIYEQLSWSQNVVDYGHLLKNPIDVSGEGWVENYPSCYRAFCKRLLQGMDAGYPYIVEADISAFYDHIHIETLIAQAVNAGMGKSLAYLLSQGLYAWTSYQPLPGRGIPQGSSASDILSKLYLNTLDHYIVSSKYDYIRYVDDLRIFAPDLHTAQEALLNLTLYLKRLGLHLNSKKTRIIETEAARVRIRWLVSGMALPETAAGTPGLLQSFRGELRHLIQQSSIVDFNSRDFRFLLRLLGQSKDPFAIGSALSLLERHPEETNAILRYFSTGGFFASADTILATVLEKLPPTYYYQIYSIVLWYCECYEGEPSEDTRKAVLGISDLPEVPQYLQLWLTRFIERFPL
jgi:hypothetical protein